MKKLIFAATIFANIALLSGCVAPLPMNYGLSPIPVDGRLREKIQFAGVSFLAPRGEDWFALPLPCREPPVAQFYAVFGKKMAESDAAKTPAAKTVVAQVVALDIGKKQFKDTAEFKLYWDNQTPIGVHTSPRHQPMASTVTIDNTLGPMCVKYRYEIEDTGLPAFPDSVFILNMTGYRCLHPLSRRYVVDIGYGQRYMKGTLPTALENEIEVFLKSLRMETYLDPDALICNETDSSGKSRIRLR